jgi:hypothetical protein
MKYRAKIVVTKVKVLFKFWQSYSCWTILDRTYLLGLCFILDIAQHKVDYVCQLCPTFFFDDLHHCGFAWKPPHISYMIGDQCKGFRICGMMNPVLQFWLLMSWDFLLMNFFCCVHNFLSRATMIILSLLTKTPLLDKSSSFKLKSTQRRYKYYIACVLIQTNCLSIACHFKLFWHVYHLRHISL